MEKQKFISCLDIGIKPYKEVWALQEELRNDRIEEKRGDMLILCQHNPVYTVGKQDCQEDWLSSFEEIAEQGIEIVQCNRGGRITYHGHGQLVAYFIFRIENFSTGVRDFVRKIEDSCIDLLQTLGTNPSRKENYPGIWVNNKKVIAIGLNIAHGVSMHGIAINVEPEMSHYKHIIPCGIRDHGVTSLAEILGTKKPQMSDVKNELVKSLERIFDFSIRAGKSEDDSREIR